MADPPRPHVDVEYFEGGGASRRAVQGSRLRDETARVVLDWRDVENRTGGADAQPYCATKQGATRRACILKERAMAAITHVYWRDIPAQVIIGKGRSGAKAPLPERFEQAIDRAAMKVGAKDDDAYLAGFHRVVVGDADGDLAEAAQTEAAALDAAYDNARLKSLIDAEGFDPTKSA